MSKSTVLSIEALGHGYQGVPVLSEVSLELNQGELVAVLGASGSGKSTLLRSVAGFVTPDTGRILVAGRVVVAGGKETIPAERRGVGMVFQDYALFQYMTVFENVAFGIHKEANVRARVADLLTLVGLQGMENRRPSTLSGGQQQRVALARALAPEPSLLVLDEPFANLDGALRHGISAELKRILEVREVSALLVTHERIEALGLASRVALLDGQGEGRAATLVQLGTPEEVYRNPATPGVASLTGPVTLLPAVASGGHAQTAIGTFPLRVEREGKCVLVLRPEDITLSPGGESTVVSRRFEGAGYSVEVSTSAGRVHMSFFSGIPPEKGAKVTLSVEQAVVALAAAN